MIFPEREIADEIAEDLLEEDDFTEVRVVREALAGEEDDEDHDWGVYVRQAPIDDAASAALDVMIAEHELGRAISRRALGDPRPARA